MRFNDHSLKVISRNLSSPDKESRLLYKAPRDSYKERLFRLKGNLLFLYRTNDYGTISEPEACGLLYVEKCKFQMEHMSDRPFVFSGTFQGEGDKKHYFSAQTLQQCHDWITILTQASYENVKAQLRNLQGKIQRRTGRDPLPALVDTSCPQLVGHEGRVKSRPKTPVPEDATVHDYESSTFYRHSSTNVEAKQNLFEFDEMNASRSTFHVLESSKPVKPTRPAPQVPQARGPVVPKEPLIWFGTQSRSTSNADSPLIQFEGMNVQNVSQINCNIAPTTYSLGSQLNYVNPQLDTSAAVIRNKPSGSQQIARPVAVSGINLMPKLNNATITPRERPKSKSPIPDGLVSAFDQFTTKAKSLTDSFVKPSSQANWETFDWYP